MVSPGIDHYSYLADSQHRPLLVGIICLLLAVAMMLSGESLSRFGPRASRWENPNRFWKDVAGVLIAGLFCIGVFLYRR